MVGHEEIHIEWKQPLTFALISSERAELMEFPLNIW